MKIGVILNKKRSSHSVLSKSNLDELAEKYNIKYDLFILEPTAILPALKELAEKSYNAFLIAGGDGTVRSAAEALIDKEIPLIILPMGTFNLFARELDYPSDLDTIFKIIKNNKTKLVDVASVNQSIFINHSAIGFYSYILKLRAKQPHRFGTGRFVKIIYTLLNIFKVLPIYKITVTTEDQVVCYNTFLTVIGNNYHCTNLFNFGSRNLLTKGLLSVYILQGKTRWECFKCITSILFNTKQKEKYLTEFETDKLTISSESSRINVDLDGDLFKLDVPLNYIIHNKKLTVLVP